MEVVLARNKVVHLDELVLKQTGIRSKYFRDKDLYIGKQYNDLFLKDVVVTADGKVLGICDCVCGEKDIATAIYSLITYKTKSCNSCMRASCTGKKETKYASNEYIGKVIGYLEVEDYYFGKIGNKSGVIWKLKCLNCGKRLEAFAGQVCNNTTVSCGCLGEARNNKYSSQNLVGTYVFGTKILEVLPKTYKETGEQYWKCECKYCKSLFIASARHIQSRHVNSCGCQTESLGCVEITEFLDTSGLNYRKEYKFDDLVSQYGGQLRYDFCILDGSAIPLALIEYDGEFHTDINHMFGNENKEKSFLDVQDSDRRKNNYAKEHKIPMLRIPYSRSAEDAVFKLKEFLYSLGLLERSISND